MTKEKIMTLYDELYFEITARGQKSDVKKFASFLKSGELDDFIEDTKDYINYDDNYSTAADTEETELVFTNDEIGVEIDEFDTDEFVELIAKAGKRLELSGTLYDSDDNEFSFTSPMGDPYYYDSRKSVRFNDELDDVAREEEDGEEE